MRSDPGYYLEYLNLLTLLLVSVILGIILLGASALLSRPRAADWEKVSTYECGFEPFRDARGPFNIRFFLIAVLFVIFDLEIVLLLPWVSQPKLVGGVGYYVGLEFLVELLVGLALVMEMGALDVSEGRDL